MKDTWILKADRVKRVLARTLQDYKPLIDEKHYEEFLLTKKQTKKNTWFKNQLPVSAVVHILSEDKIKPMEESWVVEKASNPHWDE